MMLGAIGAGVAILTLIWGMYTYYKPRTVEQQPEPKYREPRLSECLPANRVNDAIVFLDWIEKNPSGYVKTYPSFVALRPYLTILQSDGFIRRVPSVELGRCRLPSYFSGTEGTHCSRWLDSLRLQRFHHDRHIKFSNLQFVLRIARLGVAWKSTTEPDPSAFDKYSSDPRNLVVLRRHGGIVQGRGLHYETRSGFCCLCYP